MLYHVQKVEPKPPRTINAKIPKDLETICLKALHKDPTKRYGDCHELAADLRRWQECTPIHARRVGPLERLARWTKRNPLVATLSAALLIAMVAGSLISLTLAATARRNERLAVKKAAEAKRNLIRAEEEKERSEMRRKHGCRANRVGKW